MLLVRSLEAFRSKGPGSAEGGSIDWLTIKDQAESVTADVARIRAHPLVPAGVPIYGYIYDVKSGRLIEVSQAMEAGKTCERKPGA